MPTRILIADDHALFREGLKALLTPGEFEVVAFGLILVLIMIFRPQGVIDPPLLASVSVPALTVSP